FTNGLGQSEVDPVTGQYTNSSGQIQNYAWGGPISYLNTRRSTIQTTHLNPISGAVFAVNAPPAPTQNIVTLTGTAPINVVTITVNGVSYPITWTGQTTWSIQVVLATGVNNLVVQGYDALGTFVGSGTANVNGPAVDSPEGN